MPFVRMANGRPWRCLRPGAADARSADGSAPEAEPATSGPRQPKLHLGPEFNPPRTGGSSPLVCILRYAGVW